MPDTFAIRRARPEDLPALGQLGASLMRLHFAFDGQRFIAPGDQPERGYTDFLARQLADPAMLLLVADRSRDDQSPDVAGYVYAAVEPESFKELRERAGFLHDIVVADDASGSGIGAALLEAAVDWLRHQGVPRVLLWTATSNDRAQRLFTRHGFRPTMVEMTRELGDEPPN